MLKIEIRTIGDLIFEGEIEAVSFSSSEGYLTIYEGHEDMIFQVNAGQIEIETLDGNAVFYVLDGLAKIQNGENLTMLVNEIEASEEINRELIQEAIERAEGNLKKAEETEDYSEYEFQILKAKLIKELSKSSTE